MRLISWNVAGRVHRLPEQVAAIANRQPDVVALQEVTATTAPLLREKLNSLGLCHIADSLSLAKRQDLLIGPRKYGQLIASRWAIRSLPPREFKVPWSERVLSAIIDSPYDEIELHTTGIPPGCNHGFTKVKMFEGISKRLAQRSQTHRILCGDFNSPKSENSDGTIVTWGGKDVRWNNGERSVLKGLADFDLSDVFRAINRYSVQECSWCWRGRGRKIGRRFDHVFASKSLNPFSCYYLHEVRESALSDHSMIEAQFEPKPHLS